MNLALSLNAINLIVTSVMSAGVVGVIIAAVIDDDNSESEIAVVEEMDDELKNVDVKDEDEILSDDSGDKGENIDEVSVVQQDAADNLTNNEPAFIPQNSDANTSQPQVSSPVACQYDYPSRALGIAPSSEAELSTWQGLTINIFDQLVLHGSFYSPRRPEDLGIDMGDRGGIYDLGGGWTSNRSGYTFTADTNSLTVGWGVLVDSDGSSRHVTLSNSAKYQLNAMTAQMTAYLRELYSQFNARCSSFTSTLPW